MDKKIFFAVLIAAVLTQCMAAHAEDVYLCSPVGWASQNGGTTGGGTAAAVTVTTIAALQSAASAAGAGVIFVQGTMGSGVSTRVEVSANKTILGLPGAKLIGGFDISDTSNVIIRNMTVQGPGAVDVDGVDCVTVDNATNVWLDHLDIYDGQDGNNDIVNGSNYVSVTWCKYHYTAASSNHQFCNLIGNSDTKTTDRGKLKVTYMHCWWADGVVERMPRLRFGQVHVINNLFTSAGNNYCARAGIEADFRIEYNVFNGVNDPVDLYDNNFTAVTMLGNLYVSVTGNTSGSGTAFTPPYAVATVAVASLQAYVSANAGATLPGFPACGQAGTPTRTPVIPTATITRTATRTPTSTPLPAGYREIQLEYPCSMDGVLESTNAGYTGDGYANLDNVIGSAITFSLASPSAQAVSLDFRYANGSTSNRSMSVAVNGVIQIASLSFPGTGAWTTWSVSTAVVMLAPGYNTITLASLIAEGAPNLDMVSFVSTTINDGGCAPSSPTQTGTRTRTLTATASRTPSFTGTFTRTATQTGTPSFTRTYTRTITRTATRTASQTATEFVPTGTVTRTQTAFVPSVTATLTAYPVFSSTRTATMTGTVVPPSLTATATLTAYPVFSATRTSSATASVSPSVIITETPTSPVSQTRTATLTATATGTAFIPTGTVTGTVTHTHTVFVPTHTATGTATPTFTATFSMTVTMTRTASPTYTRTASATASMSQTPASTRTWTLTASATRTGTLTPAATATATNVLTGAFGINDFFTYPNPYKTETGGIYLRFDAPVQAQNCALKVYSPSFRKVIHEPVPGVFYGRAIAQVSAQRFQNLSAGVYYAVLEGESQGGEKAVSKPSVIIILK